MSRIDLRNFAVKDEVLLDKPASFIEKFGEAMCSTEERLNALKTPEGHFKNELADEKAVRDINTKIDRLKMYQEVLLEIVKKKDNWQPITMLTIKCNGNSKQEKDRYIDLLLDFLEETLPQVFTNPASDLKVNGLIYTDKSLLQNNSSEINIFYNAQEGKAEVFSNLWKRYLRTVQTRFPELLEYDG